MLIGYFDESGTHAGSKSLAIGGFVGPEKKWRRFEREWSQELRSEGLLYTHMSELESCRGLFASWDKTRARNFQVRLLDIIRAHATWGVSCTVMLNDYNQLVLSDPDKELSKKVGTPYGICTVGCVALSVEWVKKKHPAEAIQFIFESGMPRTEVTEWFARQKLRSPQLAGIAFSEKSQTLPLQAADIHAYEAWKHTENQYASGNPLRDVRRSLHALIGMPIAGRMWDRSGLQKRIAEVRNATEY